MPPFKIAQIGCGYWGPNLLRVLAFHPKVSLVAVVDSSLERQQFVQKNYPSISVYSDYHALLQDPSIDAFVIATPAHTHYQIAKEALLNNKHVLVEKPLATTLEQAVDLREICLRKDRLAMVGHTFLYNPAVHALKEQIQHHIGTLHYLYAHRLNLGVVRKDVNVWWNLAPHDLSMFLFLMDNELPSTISVNGACFIQEGVEDVAFAHLSWPSGVTASLHVSWLDPQKVRKMTVVGSRKMVIYDDMSEEKLKIYDKGIDIAPMYYDTPRVGQLSYRSGDIHIPRVHMKEPLKVEIDHFLECLENKTPCLTGPDHAVDVVALLEAGDLSLKRGGSIEKIASCREFA